MKITQPCFDADFVLEHEEEYKALLSESLKMWHETVKKGVDVDEARVLVQQYISLHPFVNPLQSLQKVESI